MTQKTPQKPSRFSYACYRISWWLVKLFYPKIEVIGAENLPKEPCIVVGNHTQMNGPICGELYFPGRRKIWCAGEMMHLKDVPGYAFEDFWSQKPKTIRWFYRLLSYIIAPLSVCVFNNASTIAVYHDSRLLSTFKQTFHALHQGNNIIIFPESHEPGNHIVNGFQDKFVDIAKLYYKRTGKVLQFIPLYNAPKMCKMYIGRPIDFCPDSSIEEERRRICTYLMDTITEIAVNLPRHVVVPYANIPKKEYPQNIPVEVPAREETHG